MNTQETLIEALRNKNRETARLPLDTYSSLLGKRVVIKYHDQDIKHSEHPIKDSEHSITITEDHSCIIITTIVAIKHAILRDCEEDMDYHNPRPNIYSTQFIISNGGSFSIANEPNDPFECGAPIPIAAYMDNKELLADAEVQFLD